MNYIELVAEPLTRQAFEPYGHVIEVDGGDDHGINEGKIARFHKLAQVSVDSERGGNAIISLAVARVTTSIPVQMKLVERHPHGSQAFIPMFEEPMLVVVAPATATVDVTKLRAFISNGKQGINYAPGVWHMPMIATRVGQQWIVVDRDGPGDNCDEYYFEEQQIIVTV